LDNGSRGYKLVKVVD